MKIQGTNPQTGSEIDEWGCSVAWLPVLMIENSKQQHHTGAAVESFRNEMVKVNKNSQEMLLATLINNEKKNKNDLVWENNK